MTTRDDWRVLIVPTHPGVQYHFCRVGLPTYFLGHWDQFHYWRPQPSNVQNVLPKFEDAQLEWGPADYARLLDDPAANYPAGYDLAWLMFNWQYKLFRERRELPKLYRVSKVAELERPEWDELLGRDDFTVVSFYPNTVAWVKETFGVDIPYIPLGLDPEAYPRAHGSAGTILSIIHSYKDRGWRYHDYVEATHDLPTLHVDHLDPTQEVYDYAALMQALQGARMYLHDGEQEYTITLIEAMMSGLPLISFRIPGIERYVQHGVNGFVADSAAQVREFCQLLLHDDELAQRMGDASRARAERDFAETRWRSEWKDVIDRYLRA
ncbi:MAG: glycosyltransferase [Myxococcota bacterium]